MNVTDWNTDPGALPRHGYRRKGKAAVQSYVLQGIPTVGPARARELIRHFGSVSAVMTADEEVLRAVDGIGARTARVINWVCQ